MRTLICLVALGIAFSNLAPGQANSDPRKSGATSPDKTAIGRGASAKPPLYFVENRGVYPDVVTHFIQGARKTLFFTESGITIRLAGEERGWVVKLEFVGARPGVAPRGEDPQPAVFSYFIGPERDWKTGLRTYARIVYHDLWPGIDLVYASGVDQLKYEFVVKPGADPSQIRLRYRGIDRLTVTETGSLLVSTPGGSFEDAAPAAYQGFGRDRVAVEMAFRLAPAADAPRGTGGIGFQVGDYDRTKTLVLDPAVLVYCGYLGGAADDVCQGIAVDASGAVYVTGYTLSTQANFPVKSGPYLTHNGQSDVFVAKVAASGAALVYCGFFGGSGGDAGVGIAVDKSGAAYITGQTASTQTTFPVIGGPDLTHNGVTDTFIAKVSASGTSLDYCGYIGGSADEWATGVAVDGAGCAYVAGTTRSTHNSFPVKFGPALLQNGSTDAFVAKVAANGKSLVYCGFIGSQQVDGGGGIAVDAQGCAYVTGDVYAPGTGFPVKGGPDLTHNGGREDAFVAKVAASGASLVYCGYIGGAGNEAIPAIAVDATGHAYVVGPTSSTQATFPVKGGPDLTFNLGSFDAFLAVVEPDGLSFRSCGYIGGRGDEIGVGVAVDSGGHAYVAGTTEGSETVFPRVVGPDLTYNGSIDGFVAKVAFPFVFAGGTPKPGGSVVFTIRAPGDEGLTYQVGSSLGVGPISIDVRRLRLSPDGLLSVSVGGLWPTVFAGYGGVVDTTGGAQASLHIPSAPHLVGIPIHTAFVTLDPKAASGIRSVSNTASFTVSR